MMYHFIFGLRGASAVAVPSAPAACCSPVAVTASFFSSSCIGCFFVEIPYVLPLESVPLEVIEQETNPRLNDLVDDEKVHSENENGDDHHRRRGADFLPGR